MNRAIAAAALSVAMAFGAAAQEQPQLVRSPVLVIDFEELFRLSGYGQSIQQDIEARSRVLAEENARIDAELAAEEKALTERRSTLPTAEFRVLADAFDEKVQRLRNEQDDKAQALNRFQAEEQLRFRQAAIPILGQMMLDSGALLVVEKRAVLVFNDGINVTGIVADRMDAAQDEGTSDAPATPEAFDPAPETPTPAPEDNR